MAKKVLKELIIDRNWCKGCRICVQFCPQKVLDVDGEDKAVASRPWDCVACGMCELRCPDLAITVVTQDAPGQEDREREPGQRPDQEQDLTQAPENGK
ncbi:4Fe-4S dicluster domain-containing protein [Fundidesulfovibrio terrae]|uniref:4Fe-4S dicluster domain-containing protein n=1 Tax=Fundidesulfovibrio terrae TaxID=2922866 RepID=UPI001FAE9A72